MIPHSSPVKETGNMSPTTKFCVVLMTKEKGVAGSREGELEGEQGREGAKGGEEKKGRGWGEGRKRPKGFLWVVAEGISRPRLEWTH